MRRRPVDCLTSSRRDGTVIELARGDDDICARLGKPLHHRATKSAAAAGDERDATVEAEQFLRRPRQRRTHGDTARNSDSVTPLAMGTALAAATSSR